LSAPHDSTVYLIRFINGAEIVKNFTKSLAPNSGGEYTSRAA